MIDNPEPAKPQKCRAQSKQTGNRCGRWPMAGKTLCKHHGGKNEKVPALQKVTHGLTSEYINVKQLPEILERVAELKSPAGKEHALLVGAALTEHRLENVPNKLEFLGAFVDGRKSVREDLKAAHEVTKAETSTAAPTTFNIVQYSADGPFRRVLSRGVEGPVTIQYIENEPYMFDAQLNAYFAASRQIDDDTGAEYFTKLLEASPSV